ncbi:MAG: DegT/DnrJ/EryC1/StrS family aminotransferase [Sphingobacteriales bacterium]|nr:MAG: DegT/DnrJ/EryC1/StrS family aminotransferase [Sphingobacteriales bacterium]
MINVTKTYLPSFDEYTAILKRAWDKSWITNNGELVQELELKLKHYLGVPHLLFTSNGTVPLQMALKVFNIKKEVITTPFSYVATTNSILWEGARPVFVDIDPHTLCIDADKIEAAVTEDTEAIMATHVYGIPCAIEKIDSIAQKYRLKVIYDAAHAFGCTYNGSSLLSYGDISTCSFHATKVFHTGEGGCIIAKEDGVAQQLLLYRSFGHLGDDYLSIGINAKNSEFHAALGLCNLPAIGEIIAARKQVYLEYNNRLKLKKIQQPEFAKNADYNYGYYPVIFESEKILLNVREALLKNGISTRRYFYPSLNRLPFLNNFQHCPISEDISSRVLALPLFTSLRTEDINQISCIVNELV